MDRITVAGWVTTAYILFVGTASLLLWGRTRTDVKDHKRRWELQALSVISLGATLGMLLCGLASAWSTVRGEFLAGPNEERKMTGLVGLMSIIFGPIGVWLLSSPRKFIAGRGGLETDLSIDNPKDVMAVRIAGLLLVVMTILLAAVWYSAVGTDM